jgi:LmbE family N-acetylglucosaminyl deacetylase
MQNVMAANTLCCELLERIGRDKNECFEFTSAVIAAHPDDEVIGLGGHFNLFKNAYFIHITDGAPRNMYDANRYGFASRSAYAYARQCEFMSAMMTAGLSTNRTIEIGIVDQEASYNMMSITYELADILMYLQPELIFTHGYEGGHPDHDATAFALHAAIKLMKRNDLKTPEVVEFGLYNGHGGGMHTFSFVPAGEPEKVIELDYEQKLLKKQLMDCFQSQKETLSQFGNERECLRPAPVYDFTKSPHDGQLYYEQFDWGIGAQKWHEFAVENLAMLGITGRI